MRVESSSPAPISSFRVIYKMERESNGIKTDRSNIATWEKKGICFEPYMVTQRFNYVKTETL